MVNCRKFFLKNKEQDKKYFTTTSIQYFTGGSSQSNMMKKKTKGNKRYKDWKRRNLTAIICIAIIAYIKNWEETVCKLIIEFNKVAGYKNQY